MRKFEPIQILAQYNAYRKDMFASHEWLFGVEHEFFVLDKEGLPATPLAVNSLFEFFHEKSKYKKLSSRDGLILKVGNDSSRGYANLKYDQEPCLLEFSSAVHFRLGDLHEEVSEVFDLLSAAEKVLEIKVLHSPYLPVDAASSHLLSQHHRWVGLREFRKECAKLQGVDLTEGEANYGCVIAATQVQVSGKNLDWFKNPKIIENLYAFEPSLLEVSHKNSPPGQRWGLYKKIFGAFPLVGYPELKDWTIRSWLDALEVSPYFNDLFVKADTGLPKKWLASRELYIHLKKIRDFQIIRPKIYSALEFRSDPAMTTPKEIMELVAIRTAVCKYNSEIEQRNNFQESRNIWWSKALSENCLKESGNLRDQLINIAKRRGDNEIKNHIL